MGCSPTYSTVVDALMLGIAYSMIFSGVIFFWIDARNGAKPKRADFGKYAGASA
jgi:hypothetical protein